MTDGKMTSLAILRDWCRDTCACYPEVEIQSLCASFRDGLAFCAIIHKHRPELIDFSCLSRDNSYQNNQLAFETAEMKLGIPALLHPKELLSSSEAPDPLGVLTYLSWYYCFFSRMSCAGLASSAAVKRLPRTKSPDGPEHDADWKVALSLRRSSKARVRAVCRLCLRPVHLIQRRLVAGKIYHRGCLRCGVCRCTLLPLCYTQRGDSGALVCSHHPADSQVTELSAPAETRLGGSTLRGSAVRSAPRNTASITSEDKLASETADVEGKGGEETSVEGADSTAGGQRSRDPSGSAPDPSEGTQEQPSESDPAPGCKSSPSSVPVAPPRDSTSLAAENSAPQCSCSARTQRSSSSGGAGLRLNHPWLTIIHPGPWMHLPAAPPPAPLRVRHRSRAPPPNPFEGGHEKAKPHKAAANQSGKGGGEGGAGIQATTSAEEPGRRTDETIAGEVHDTGAADARAGGAPSKQPQLPRSLSVLAPTSATCCIPPAEQRESASREAPCEPDLTKSQPFQASASTRAPAPSHGFPLIRRKVQTDHDVSPESLQLEVADLDKRLEAMEWRGVELERSLRDCGDEEEEEEMLMEWFTLNHERHVLVRRDMELGYLTMQEKLEERQAGVEYELRRLFIKQENEWTEDERGEERQLMEELLSVIEQRNQIICSLDQDVQRERKEDKLLKATLNSKDLQKEGLKELRKSKGKLNPSKVFKLLHRRAAAGAKHPPDQRS